MRRSFLGPALSAFISLVFIACSANNTGNKSQIRDLQATIAALQSKASQPAAPAANTQATALAATKSSTATPPPSPTPTPSPTLSPTPTPAPVAKKIGSPVLVGSGDGSVKLEITVNSLKDPSPSTNQFNRPMGRFVLLDWTIRNVGTKETDLNPLYLKLQTTDGFLVQEANHAGQPEPSVPLSTLGPGQTVRGFESYDVAAGAVLKAAIFQPSGSPQIVIADFQ
jgi:Domain of unknown function (DUF4352)